MAALQYVSLRTSSGKVYVHNTHKSRRIVATGRILHWDPGSGYTTWRRTLEPGANAYLGNVSAGAGHTWRYEKRTAQFDGEDSGAALKDVYLRRTGNTQHVVSRNRTRSIVVNGSTIHWDPIHGSSPWKRTLKPLGSAPLGSVDAGNGLAFRYKILGARYDLA